MNANSGTSARLLEAVSVNRDRMLELTRQLVAIPTENPPGNRYGEAVDLLTRHLRDLGFADTRVEGDCVLSFIGDGEPTLYFSGHYDVVPAQNPAQFEARVNGANLFGRGSSDMKSGLAAMIYAAKALLDSGARLHGRIGLVFVPDEETAGPRGSRYLAERGLLGQNAIGMLTPEPTGGVVWNGNRGAITLKVTVRGKSAHVGRQHEGVNAFERMLELAQAFVQLRSEIGSVLLVGGRSEAGSSFNTVPDSAWFTIDRRIDPEEDFEEERQRLLNVVKRARGDVDIEVLQEGRSCRVPEDSAVGRALANSIQAVTGKAAQFETCPGLLEIRFYAERGIPAYAYGPGLLSVSHGPNEFVPVGRILECAQVYALTAAALLSHG